MTHTYFLVGLFLNFEGALKIIFLYSGRLREGIALNNAYLCLFIIIMLRSFFYYMPAVCIVNSSVTFRTSVHEFLIVLSTDCECTA